VKASNNGFKYALCGHKINVCLPAKSLNAIMGPQIQASHQLMERQSNQTEAYLLEKY
jgi:hypothetical protein